MDYVFFTLQYWSPDRSPQCPNFSLSYPATNQIKTVFVGLFYSAIVPTGLIVTAVAMIIIYWVDKYSLLRLWKRPPVRETRRVGELGKVRREKGARSLVYRPQVVRKAATSASGGCSTCGRFVASLCWHKPTPRHVPGW